MCGICFAEPDTFVPSEDCVGVFGEGTRLAMPKTMHVPDCWTMKIEDRRLLPCPDGTLLCMEGKLGDSDVGSPSR